MDNKAVYKHNSGRIHGYVHANEINGRTLHSISLGRHYMPKDESGFKFTNSFGVKDIDNAIEVLTRLKEKLS